MEVEKLREDFYSSLIFLDKIKAKEILGNFSSGKTLLPFIEKIVAATLIRIGKEWDEGIISLSQVYMSGKICEEIIDEVLPKESLKRKRQPKAAIVMLQDHHILGKRIVYSVLRASGFELEDWGYGQTVEEIIKKYDENKVEVLLISTLMLNSALKIKSLIPQLRKKNEKIKVIVGGAPFIFDKDLWKEVGADAMGENASDAVRMFYEL